MQFKDWESPSNEISSEGLDMDAFTEEEVFRKVWKNISFFNWRGKRVCN